ncbi:hypothetical protein G7054_g14947 [Neopestalotiopsis clavispora]|nr:hypothetical protein G7054_g14947 [Neopestalotiopsis clavispora]
MSVTIKVGVVGYGNSAKNFHLPLIQAVPSFELVAILQRSAAPSSPTTTPVGLHCSVDFPAVHHYRTVDDFFENSTIDLVVVATTNDSHGPIAKMALETGRHVIIDKPFTHTTAEADELIQLADQKGLILTCFQNRRWLVKDGDFQTLRQLIDAGALGEVKEAELHYDFESAGSWFSGDQTDYTPGTGMTFALGPDKDLLVTIKSCIVTIMSQQLKYIIRGTKGSFFKQRSTCVQEEQISKGLGPSDPGFGIEPASSNGILTTIVEFDSDHQNFDQSTGKFVGRYPTVPGSWLSLYENLAAAIKGICPIEVQATQVRDVLRIIELARMSHTQNRTIEWNEELSRG